MVGRDQCGARNVEDLVRSGIVSPEELEDVRAANEFLLRARIALHYKTDGKTDRMGFEDQEAIARTLTRTRAPDGREVRMQPMAVDVPDATRELGFPPKYGADTAKVLDECGYAQGQIEALRGDGIIA